MILSLYLIFVWFFFLRYWVSELRSNHILNFLFSKVHILKLINLMLYFSLNVSQLVAIINLIKRVIVFIFFLLFLKMSWRLSTKIRLYRLMKHRSTSRILKSPLFRFRIFIFSSWINNFRSVTLSWIGQMINIYKVILSKYLGSWKSWELLTWFSIYLEKVIISNWSWSFVLWGWIIGILT